MMQSNTAVQSVTGAEKVRILDFMRSLSPNVDIDEDGVVTKRQQVGGD